MVSSVPVKIELRKSANEPLGPKDCEQLGSRLGLHPVVVELLSRRGVSGEDGLKEFLSPSLKEHLPDPKKILGIKEAARLILEHVLAKKSITVLSDYDVDGTSSGAQLVLFLSELGAKVNSYTPNRFTDGYGLSKDIVRRLAELGTELLVTVDCGISSVEEIKLAKEKGLSTIILDHHIPAEIPEADVVVDPAQPGCPFGEYQLSASGLVWMLLIVLRAEIREKHSESFESVPDPKDFLDLAALGTICDMVPLVGPNRLIASKGLEVIRSNKRPGLKALLEVTGTEPGKRFGAGQVGFIIGPRINAVGRLGDATEVVELLTTGNSSRAKSIAKAMDKKNTARRPVESQNLEKALELVEASDPKTGIVVFDESFHAGVIGIVAQRLVERFYRPTAVIAPGDGGVLKGSVRSIAGFHVAEALGALGEILIGFGGHKAAGGFSFKRELLGEFVSGFNQEAKKRLGAEELIKTQAVDLNVPLEVINFELVEQLSSISPFGLGNPTPVFYSEDVLVESVTSLSKDHLKLKLAKNDFKIPAVAWKFAGHPLLVKDKRVSLAYSPEINTYQGVSSVQLNVKHVA